MDLIALKYYCIRTYEWYEQTWDRKFVFLFGIYVEITTSQNEYFT